MQNEASNNSNDTQSSRRPGGTEQLGTNVSAELLHAAQTVDVPGARGEADLKSEIDEGNRKLLEGMSAAEVTS